MKANHILTPVMVAALTAAAWAQAAPAAPAKPPIVTAPVAAPAAPAPIAAPPAALPPGVIDTGAAPVAPGVPALAASDAPAGTLWIGTIGSGSVVARGGATVFSHPVFKFEKGEPVFILEEVTLKNVKAGEPKQWLRVQVPGNVGLWVHSKFLVPGPNPQTFTVAGTKLNVRAGHGDNFPVLGTLVKGDTVLVTARKVNEWQEIAAPLNTFVFVAAELVVKQAAGTGPLVSNVVTLPDPTLSKVLPKIPSQGNPGVNPAASGRKDTRPPSDTIISVPLESFDPTRKNTDPSEAFPAPPIPIKANPPAGLKNPKTGLAPAPAKVAGTPATPDKETPAKITGNNPPAPTETVKPTEPAKVVTAPTPPVTTPTLPVIPAPTEPAKIVAVVPPVEPIKPAATTPTAPVPAVTKTEVPTEKPPVRIIVREGIVQRTLNIQAPAPFVLEHLESGKVINYLLLDNPKLPLKMLRGRRVLITGEEAIDPRWPDTPVLQVKTLKTTDDLEP